MAGVSTPFWDLPMGLDALAYFGSAGFEEWRADRRDRIRNGMHVRGDLMLIVSLGQFILGSSGALQAAEKLCMSPEGTTELSPGRQSWGNISDLNSPVRDG
jgi:hypothetical protein